jgi:hypothetical protein
LKGFKKKKKTILTMVGKGLNTNTYQLICGGFMAKQLQIFKNSVERFPRLDTVLMVEKAILEAKDYPSKTQLLKSLPKKIMWPTLNAILDYLEYSGKIIIDKRDNHIVWVWAPKLVEKYMKKPELSWRQEK